MPPDESTTLQGQTGTEGTVDPGQQTDQQNDGLATGFLSRIPEQDREIVGKYVSQWDAGVTRRFQELHGKYKPYEDLGELENLQRAKEIYDILEQEPERIYSALHELYADQQNGQVDPQQQQNGLEGEEESPLQGALTELQGKFDQQTQVLEAVAQYILNQQQVTQESKEDQELTDYMGLLKQEYGEFDDDYVLTKMYHGMSGEDAVGAWKELIQGQVNQSNQPMAGLPAILSNSGGSALPVGETQRLGSIPSKDVQALVADVLAQVHREG